MKKDLLLSIHSEYATRIVRGGKTVELRRKFPLFQKKDRKKIFIYACSPISQIIGECDLREVKRFSLKKLWTEARFSAMIDYRAFKKYFEDCNFGFALYLENPIKYNHPLNIKQVFDKNSRPPQSYRYIVSRKKSVA